jgi:hypothetical protein
LLLRIFIAPERAAFVHLHPAGAVGCSPVRPLIGWQEKTLFPDFYISGVCLGMLLVCLFIEEKCKLTQKKSVIIKNGIFGGRTLPCVKKSP